TPAFVRQAGEAGFSVDQLVSAEEELMEQCYSSLGHQSMAKRVVHAMVAKATEKKCKPWTGPLPPPRRSPPMTFGAALEKASVLFRGTHWLRFWSQMQRCEQDKESIRSACRHLEALA
ncbi:unnamed protein product, partial [Urochloa humidicola]